MKTKKLPDKPSDLLMLALVDLEITEKNPKYKIAMHEWYSRFSDSPLCLVCLAGAVIAQELTEDIPEGFCVLMPENFDLDTANKLRKIDQMRTGTLPIRDEHGSWMNYFSIDTPQDRVVSYGDPEWWDHMCAIVGILQAEGL